MNRIMAIESKIQQKQDQINKLKQKVEQRETELLELLKLKKQKESKQIMDAFIRSGKSLDEVMVFLNP